MILRQFTQNDNGSLCEMQFKTQEDADAYVIPDDRKEIKAVPRPSPDHTWRGRKWVERGPQPAPVDLAAEVATLRAALLKKGTLTVADL